MATEVDAGAAAGAAAVAEAAAAGAAQVPEVEAETDHDEEEEQDIAESAADDAERDKDAAVEANGGAGGVANGGAGHQPDVLYWDEPIQWKPSVAVGLANLGNTCYLNSILEALVHCPPVVAFFCHKWPDAGAMLYYQKPNRSEFVNHFADLVRAMWAEGRDNEEHHLKKFLTPRDLVRGVIRAVPEFRENGQQDAQEALNYIMNDLHEELAVRIDSRFHPARKAMQLLDSEQKASKRSHRSNASRATDTASGAGGSTSGRRRKFKPSFRRRTRGRSDANGANGAAHAALPPVAPSPVSEASSVGANGGAVDDDEDASSSIASPRAENDDEDTDGEGDKSTFLQLEKEYSQSIISDTFLTLLVQRVTCKQCGYTSMSLEEYLELSLALPSKALVKDLRRREEAEEQEIAARGRSMSTSSGTSNNSSNGGLWGVMKTLKSMVGYESQMLSLRECMQAFFAPEQLTGDEQYYCEKCRAKQDAVKSHAFAHLPEVLCLNLKRFNRTSIAWTLNSTKNQTPVVYPVNDLDLSDFYFDKNSGHAAAVDPAQQSRRADAQADPSECMYDLVAVVRHSGGMNGGHYTSVCRNPVNDKWYEYDDDQVRVVSEANVQSNEAYLLFYRKHRSAASRESFKELHEALAQSAEECLEGEEARFISQYWTLKWATLGRPGVCGTFDSTCPHGRLLPLVSPSIDSRIFRVTPQVYNTIDRLYGAASTLQEVRECSTCVEERVSNMERREEEKAKIRELEGAGPASYILSNTWAKSWQRFVRNSPQMGRGTFDGVTAPGPIDNEPLLQPLPKGVDAAATAADGSAGGVTREPKPDLRRDVHYIIINRGIWDYLHARYGGGPTLVSSAQLIYDLDRDPFVEDQAESEARVEADNKARAEAAREQASASEAVDVAQEVEN